MKFDSHETLRNLISRLSTQLFALVINLLMAPFVIRSLGVSSYGIVGLANSVVAITTVLTITLTSTVGRDMIFSLTAGHKDLAQRQFNTSLFGLVYVLSAAAPAAIILITAATFTSDSSAAIFDTKIFILFSFISFCFATISGPLGASMYVKNRFDLLGTAALIKNAISALAIVFLFHFFTPSLAAYGFSILLGSVILYISHQVIHKALMPEITIQRNYFNGSMLKKNAISGGWMTINQVGVLLFLQADILVAGYTLGPKGAGEMAAIGIVGTQIRAFSGMITGIFSPKLSQLKARGKGKEFSTYLFRAIRFTGIFTAILLAPIAAYSQEIIGYWLGAQFLALTPSFLITICYLSIVLGLGPVWNALFVLNRVRAPAIATVASGLLHIALATMLSQKYGIIGITTSGLVMMLLRNAVFTPWYASKTSGLDQKSFYKEICIIGTVTAATYILCLVGRLIYTPSNFVQLCLSITVSIAAITLVLFQMLKSMLRQL